MPLTPDRGGKGSEDTRGCLGKPRVNNGGGCARGGKGTSLAWEGGEGKGANLRFFAGGEKG